ncbi:MAG: alpha/beta hydrolase [Pirellulaceae bacterium]|nr:alpha/beta hydrolase [Pirellulaceae bacterium]
MSSAFRFWSTLTLILLFAKVMMAQAEPLPIALWQGQAAGAIGQEPKDNPEGLLYLLPPPSGNADSVIQRHPCLVILPGGGYGNLAIDHEGYQIAHWANSMGMVALICKYRNRRDGYGHPVPMQDAQRAIRLARANADAWNVDRNKVGIIGFSAGGHLASTVLTHFDAGQKIDGDKTASQSSRPDFGILCYPVISIGKSYAHAGSRKNLLGSEPDPKLVELLNNEDQVTPQTPPTFLFHTQEDTVVHPENSLAFYSAMVRHQVVGELHFFQKGKHGVGLAAGISGTEKWPDLCRQWLIGLDVIR